MLRTRGHAAGEVAEQVGVNLWEANLLRCQLDLPSIGTSRGSSRSPSATGWSSRSGRSGRLSGSERCKGRRRSRCRRSSLCSSPQPSRRSHSSRAGSTERRPGTPSPTSWSPAGGSSPGTTHTSGWPWPGWRLCWHWSSRGRERAFAGLPGPCEAIPTRRWHPMITEERIPVRGHMPPRPPAGELDPAPRSARDEPLRRPSPEPPAVASSGD